MAAKKNGSFESYDSRSAHTMSSDRTFGYVMAVASLVFTLLPLRKGEAPWIKGLAVSAVFAVLALAAPKVLRPLNIVWFRFGLFMSPIMNTIITALLYFLVMTPIGWVRRQFTRDPLRLRFVPEAKTYWIPRTPPGPPPASMADQF